MGGNLFTNAVSIERINIEPTIQAFIEDLSLIFPRKSASFKQFILLGSTGNVDVSGDIDLGYDVENIIGEDVLLYEYGITPYDYIPYFQKFTKSSRTATRYQIQVKSFIHCISDYAKDYFNVSTKHSGSGSLSFLVKQYNSDGEFLDKYVQIDVKFGDLDWLKFVYCTTIHHVNIKGLHRTQLILSMFSHKGYTLNHNFGIYEKSTNQRVTNSPESAVALLDQVYELPTGYRITLSSLDDFWSIISIIMYRVTHSDMKEILDTYLKILDSTRCDIPFILQSNWINSQERLNLTGKFLPNDSKLISFQKL